MRFSRDTIAANTVRKIESSSITIGDREYRDPVGLLTDRVLEHFPDCVLEELNADRLAPILQYAPELLLLGTGAHYRPAPRELVFALARQGIGIEVMDTPAACRTFNILVAEGRLPAAILFIGS